MIYRLYRNRALVPSGTYGIKSAAPQYPETDATNVYTFYGNDSSICLRSVVGFLTVFLFHAYHLKIFLLEYTKSSLKLLCRQGRDLSLVAGYD